MYLLYFKDHINNVGFAKVWDSTKFYQHKIDFSQKKKK